MAKVRERDAEAVDASTALLDELHCADLRGIDFELVAAHCGAFVTYSKVDCRGRALYAGGVAIVSLPVSSRGKPWARSTMAHETGHLRMHRGIDHYAMCTGEAVKPGPRHRVERQAEDFAATLLMPARTMRVRCNHARPRIEHLASIAEAYGTSLIATAIRYVELTDAPCAVAKIVEGRVSWAIENESYPGRVVQRRPAGREAWGDSVAVETAPIDGIDATMAWILPARVAL